jgi:PilZ domain
MSNAPQNGNNRRIHVRLPPKGSTKVTCRRGCMDLGPNLALRMLDISEGGVCVLVREVLTVRQEVAVTLEGTNHRRALRMLGRVSWCQPQDDNQHLVGIHFEKRLAYQEVHKLA